MPRTKKEEAEEFDIKGAFESLNERLDKLEKNSEKIDKEKVETEVVEKTTEKVETDSKLKEKDKGTEGKVTIGEPAGAGSSMSFDDVSKMTAAQINENWDEVKKVLSSQNSS